jgi:signal transduction histidine kinase
MSTRLTILKKALFLMAAPLVIQAVFMGMLIQTHFEAESAQRWAVHTKEVIARVEVIYRRLLEGYAGSRILVVSENPAFSQPFRDALARMPEQVSELSAIVDDNKWQQQRVATIADQSRALRDWVAGQERLVQTGERGKALDKLDEGASLLGEVRKTTDLILASESQLGDERMERLERAGARQLWTLIVGGIVFLGATFVLSLLFLHGVLERLAVLRDNARSYALGKGLDPPLTGSDEIAEVDRAFHEMAAGLDQQKQENEMFVYSVSHDLRSPLINLQGFSEELSLSCRDLQALFRNAEIPSDARPESLKQLTVNIEESIRYIQTAVGRLARIIDALLRLSRAGRVEYQLHSLDVAMIVQRIVDALKDSIASKKAEVVVRTLPPAWGDATAVEQIFANLITNAVQYLDGARSGTIEVGSLDSPPAGKTADFHVYYVKDNGLGIPEAYHKRVFTAFSRLHADVPQGEGIGLALVRRMVARHGGKIWLESAADVGTTFYVALPAGAPPGESSLALDRPVLEVPKGEQRTWQPSRS